jgi:hypothetical protein
MKDPAKDWTRGEGRMWVTACGYRVSVRDDKTILNQVVVMPAQLCEYTENLWITHFTRVKF